MYWGQLAVAIGVSLLLAARVLGVGNSVGVAAAVAVLSFIAIRWLLAWIFRTRFWYKNGRKDWAKCGNCGQTIWRLGGDWILECKRCGWRAGRPGFRWLTHSVLANQFRRTLNGPILPVFVFVAVLLVTGVAGSVTVGGLESALGSVGSMSENTTEAPHTESMSEIPSTETDVITQTPGTDDRDKDRLSDEAERAGETAEGWKLPDAEPDTKDLFVQIFVTENVPELTPFELDDLRDIWRSMPVENPSNETGIRLHIQQVPVNRSMTVELSEPAFEEQEREFYGERLHPAARCTVHVVLLTRTTSDSFYSGRANAPGYMAIVDGTGRQRYGEEYTVRVATITHELLHNIVGVFDNGRSHTYSGWLDGGPTGTHGDEFYMSNMTAEKLSEDGFASSAYYESEYC